MEGRQYQQYNFLEEFFRTNCKDKHAFKSELGAELEGILLRNGITACYHFVDLSNGTITVQVQNHTINARVDKHIYAQQHDSGFGTYDYKIFIEIAPNGVIQVYHKEASQSMSEIMGTLKTELISAIVGFYPDSIATRLD